MANEYKSVYTGEEVDESVEISKKALTTDNIVQTTGPSPSQVMSQQAVTLALRTAKAATVQVGTTTTGPAGSSASVTNSGTEYDAILNFTIPQGEQGIQGPAGAGSNPNLLINSNFNINQKGQSSYINATTEFSTYCIDKWTFYGAATFDVSTKTLTNNNSSSTQIFLIQYLNSFELFNKTLSISCLIDGVKYSASGTSASSYNSNTTIFYAGTSTVRFEFCYNTNYGFFVQFRVNAGVSVVIDECKLEMGGVATPFSPRPYEEDLALCQMNGLEENPEQAMSTTFSNPNLLINGGFRVNQRGETSYSNFANKYCVDRWRTAGGNVTVTPMDYGCSVSVGEDGQYYPLLEQIIEDYASLIGKTVTLSANIKSVSVNLQSYQYCIRIRCYDTNNELITTSESWITTAGNYSCALTIPSNTVKVSCTLYKNAEVTCTFEIEYMKLEVGSVATPYSPRPYAEELAMCQRYYQVIKVTGGYGTVSNLGVPRNTTTLRFYINLLTQLRTQPTVSNTETSIINLNTGSITQIDDNSLALQSLLTNQIVLNYATTGLILGQIYNLTDSNGQLKMEFDAEIY